MSDDLIRRSDAIKTIEAEECLGYVECKTEHLINQIRTIETIKPKRGEWIDNGDRYFRCSLCGTKDMDKWHWCHGCGADMRAKEGE